MRSPNGLDQSRGPSDDLVDTLRSEAGEVSGAELVELAAASEVVVVLGVPHHDVVAPEDQFAITPGSAEAGCGRSSNEPPGMGMPMAPGCSAARCGGRYAIRAVASVCPYITNSSTPCRRSRSDQCRT